MFNLHIFLFLFFVQLACCFHKDGLIGFVFGFQKICLCRCGVSKTKTFDFKRTSRFLGGEDISPHQYPWLASITTGSLSFSGSLLTDRHVLTAASPLYGVSPSNVVVSLGAHDRCSAGETSLNISVSFIQMHPAYSPTNANNDIALLRLRHVVPFNNYIAPVCMPVHGSHGATNTAWTAGWANDGNLSTCVPRTVSLPILSTSTCLKLADSQLHSKDKGCLGPVGTNNIICKTDVGAPVMTRLTSNGVFKLIGVISGATSCNQQVPPLFTKVLDHAEWIYTNIRMDCQCF